MAARAGAGGGLSCPACAGPLARWREAPAFEPSDDRTFSLLRCERCGTAVTAGEPPGPDAYASGIYAPREPRFPRLIAWAQRRLLGLPLRLLEDTAPGPRVLDAGAGRGRLVALLRQAGFDAAGIDPRGDPPATIETFEASGLDAVVLWHVLEHLDDPLAALQRVRGWLRPGGVVLIGVPNVASLQSRVAGPKWFHLDLPRHRTHFTEAGLKSILERAGFRPDRIERDVLQHNPLGMWLALLTRLGMTPGFPFHLLKRNVRARPRDVALLMLAGPPLAPVAFLLSRGGTIAVGASRS